MTVSNYKKVISVDRKVNERISAGREIKEHISAGRRVEIVNLLERVWNLHEFYLEQTTEEGRGKIIDGSQSLLDKLEKLEVKRAFSETFLVFGNEFLISEFGLAWDKMKRVYLKM